MTTTKSTASKPASATKPVAGPAVKSEDIVATAVTAHRKTVEAVTSAGKEAVETVVKAGNDVARKGYDEAMTKGREQVETVVQANIDAIRGLEGIAAINESGIEAAIHANTTFARGIEKLADEWLGYARSSTEIQAETVRRMFSAKSPTEVVATQADFAKQSFTSSLEQSRRLQAMSVAVFESVSRPVVEHFWKTSEAMTATVRNV